MAGRYHGRFQAALAAPFGRRNRRRRRRFFGLGSGPQSPHVNTGQSSIHPPTAIQTAS
jgi:hypothetical protein